MLIIEVNSVILLIVIIINSEKVTYFSHLMIEIRSPFPFELGVLERETQGVIRGKEIVTPRSDRTRGHGTHTASAVWKGHLIELLKTTGRGTPESTEGH